MRLFFLRHGEAERRGSSDFERELTDSGKQASKAIGLFCKKTNINFSAVFTSPIKRAQQTTHLVLKALSNITPNITDSLTPDSDPRNLFELLKSFTSESKILFVTHEPFVSTCISTLIAGTETARIVMKPCSLACVETDGVPARGNGILLWLLHPELVLL